MLKLFYASGSSAMAPHILLTDMGLKFELEKVNLDQKHWHGGDYHAVTPKSYVPALAIAPQQYLTECAVILEYIALQGDQREVSDYGSLAYWQERMWLNYLATELHKNFISPFRSGNWLPNTVESKKTGVAAGEATLSLCGGAFAGPVAHGESVFAGRPVSLCYDELDAAFSFSI